MLSFIYSFFVVKKNEFSNGISSILIRIHSEMFKTDLFRWVMKGKG